MKKTKIAVYDSLLKGCQNHHYINKANFIGSFWTLPLYTMYNICVYPGIIKAGHTSVYMELYEVDEDTLLDIDYLQSSKNPDESQNEFNRKPIDTPYGKALTYEYNSLFLSNEEEIIEEGHWKTYDEFKTRQKNDNKKTTKKANYKKNTV